MKFQRALEIMVNGTDDSDEKYEAVMTIESAVVKVSEFGDPDRSLQDWISAGQFKSTDTPESIASEWDSDRD
jgi:hypothetical protein